jgi:hypothetical protein
MIWGKFVITKDETNHITKEETRQIQENSTLSNSQGKTSIFQ